MTMKNSNMYIYTHEYQKGMTIEVEERNKHQLQIKVSAEFSEGKVLVLNMEKNAFQVKNSENLRVKFDGQEIKLGNIEDVINGEGVEAKYATALGEDGSQFIIYIPHFSEHIISFELIDITDEKTTDFILGALGAAMLTIIVMILIIVRIGKYRE